MFKKYYDAATMIFFRPILFFSKMPQGEWKDDAFNFCGMTSFLISFVVSLVVFINQLIPIGSTLWEGLSGIKMLMVLPIMVVLAFMFFIIIFSIVGGILMAVFFALFYAIGCLQFWAGKYLGGKGELNLLVKASLYSSAVFLIMILAALLALLSKRGIIDFTNFRIGYNIVYSFVILYLYGILAIAQRKVHGFEKWKAFSVAVLPIILMIIIGIVIDKAILPKVVNWVT
ncbi:MAG: hypothetical protein FD145_505 [Candidatus Saganbacteria bacterium]|uniref:Yip1 domain-containing protein n=1 Tax=Candidatus Saganbacteria bacterium TaxID=2575572 RepID=A0A833L1Q5_UNCSA|nr:MAG: hypothetical protein FD145_505 [Candidatus Saganbacteria bacterium]